jgi:hypothetical protein
MIKEDSLKNYNMQGSGSLANASNWQYSNKKQIQDLPDEKLKQEWESVSTQARAFSQGRVPWTDELFFCFFGFTEEMNRRKFKT